MQSVRRSVLMLIVGLCGLAIIHDNASADGGVPIPAPAGTTWSVVAGYNTATHSVHDGNDRHALDIVRVPRDQTAFTPVLAPVSGTVAWRGWDGLSITDSAGFDHVIAHVAPSDHVRRGVAVTVGEQVAIVCQAFECRNGGLAHIHYAVHQSRGDGYLGPSVPFAGPYALEGISLPDGEQANLHAGLEFTSTNVANWTPPASEPAPPTESAEASELGTTPTDTEQTTTPKPVWTQPVDAPVGGWRLVGVHQNTSVAGLFANLRAPLTQLIVHIPQRNSYQIFDPDNPASADIAVRSLKAGQAVWGHVTSESAWLPAPPLAPQQVTLQLLAGRNLVSWQGSDRSLEDALANVQGLSHAYRFDPYTKTWLFWSPDAPESLNTWRQINSGDAFYLAVHTSSTWTQQP